MGFFKKHKKNKEHKKSIMYAKRCCVKGKDILYDVNHFREYLKLDKDLSEEEKLNKLLEERINNPKDYYNMDWVYRLLGIEDEVK